MTPRTYIEIAAGMVLIIAFGIWSAHERHQGETQVHTADAKALSEARKRVDAETALNVTKAVQADEVAAHAQQAVDDYVAAHPIGVVRVCHSTNDSSPGMPKAGANVGITVSTGPGPAPIREVQDGTAGPNIGPGIDELVLAASRVATLYADKQQR